MIDIDRFQDKYGDMFRPDTVDFDPFSQKHECLSCEQKFVQGVSIDGDKFCDPCHKSHEHFTYYRRQGATDRDIWENEKYTKRL